MRLTTYEKGLPRHKRLESIRLRSAMTQTDVCQQAGIDPGQYSKTERAINPITIGFARKFCKRFDLSFSDIYETKVSP